MEILEAMDRESRVERATGTGAQQPRSLWGGTRRSG